LEDDSQAQQIAFSTRPPTWPRLDSGKDVIDIGREESQQFDG
jgi:hypothetical protein